jgi:hypothetical protein
MNKDRVGLRSYDPAACYRGYTLFCGDDGPMAYLVDMQGRVCQRWRNERGMQYANLLPNGNLLCRAAPSENVEGQQGLNGQAPSVFEIDWDGNLVWEYCDDWLHHDQERLPNGNTLVITWERMSEEQTARVQGGVHSDDDDPRMLGDVVREIAPDGSVVRQWRSWEHLDFDAAVICPLEHRLEWTHCNSISTTAGGDWILSLRRINTVVVVDPDSGTVKWSWGPGVLGHQHDAKLTPSGNLMVFDNGVHRHGPEYSQALEIDMETRDVVWQFVADPPFAFYSFMAGNADRLPNGNTLICESAVGRIFEVTAEKHVVWEYINPYFVSNPRLGGRINITFRAHRYGPDYPGLRDKNLDADQYANLNRLYDSA